MNPPTIGILAGMGPRSTAPFVDMVITECQSQYAARDVEDFPHMLIYSLPAPFYADRPIDHERAETVVRQGLQRLEGGGVDFVAMPCNTAHCYYDRLAADSGVPLLNMVSEGVGALQNHFRIAICATPATIASGLYQKGIAAAGKQTVATERIQPSVSQLIAGIIAGADADRSRALWDEIVAGAIAEGADAVLVACTELNALGELKDNRIAIVDSTAALARATVREYLKIKAGSARELRA